MGAPGDEYVCPGERDGIAEVRDQPGIFDDQIVQSDGRNHRSSGFVIHGSQSAIDIGEARISGKNLDRPTGQIGNALEEHAPGGSANQAGIFVGNPETELVLLLHGLFQSQFVHPEAHQSPLAESIIGAVARFDGILIAFGNQLPAGLRQNFAGFADMLVGIEGQAHERGLAATLAQSFERCDGRDEDANFIGGLAGRAPLDDSSGVIQEEIVVGRIVF